MAKFEMGINDLLTANYNLAQQWDYEANKGLLDKKGRDISTPDKVTCGSQQDVWWKLPYDVPMDYPIEHLRGKHFEFNWMADIKSRNKGIGCPYLSGNALWKGFNDLATTYPQLAKQWDYEGNKGLKDKNGKDISTPDKVFTCSRDKVWWMYPYDVPLDYPIEHLRGKHFDFKWSTTVIDRAKYDLGCPYLTGRAVWKGFNDLETVNQKIASEWDYVTNKGLTDKNGNDISTPDKVTANSNHKVAWIYHYEVPIDYPVEHLRGKHFDFKWEAKVEARNLDSGCPYLSVPPQAVWKGFNDLATVNPELAKEWDYEANKGLKGENGKDISTPDKVTAGSFQKVNWIYLHTDNETGELVTYKWKAAVSNRSNGSGCPFIFSSKGEKTVKKILTDNNISFEEQYKFKDRFYKTPSHPLRDDFAVFDKYGNVVGAIEFHGQQHYEIIDFSSHNPQRAKEQFEDIQKRDKIKSDYLKVHGIKQLIVPYTEFDNVEQIVKDFLEELSKDFDLYPQNHEKDKKSWTPPQDKPSKKEVKTFMQKILKGDANNYHLTNKENIVTQNTNDLSIDL